jgi:2-haloacid dehalogenase
MAPGTISPLAEVKALAFDVFGTVVDWRSSVTEELYLRAFRKLSSDLPGDLKAKLEPLTEADWGRFAQDWRDTYAQFTKSFDPTKDEWKTVDEHHRDSLRDLLADWGLEGLYSEAEIESLSLVWHRLTPWPDAAEGLAQLGKEYTLSTLSNGNSNLLRDLNDYGGLGFEYLLCAETFRVYKPDPKTYLGAARELGVEPHQLALVATHLKDLAAAQELGLRTVYVERLAEEEWGKDEERYKAAKERVDLWVTIDEEGFLTVVRKLAEL